METGEKQKQREKERAGIKSNAMTIQPLSQEIEGFAVTGGKMDVDLFSLMIFVLKGQTKKH